MCKDINKKYSRKWFETLNGALLVRFVDFEQLKIIIIIIRNALKWRKFSLITFILLFKYISFCFILFVLFFYFFCCEMTICDIFKWKRFLLNPIMFIIVVSRLLFFIMLIVSLQVIAEMLTAFCCRILMRCHLYW